MRAFVKNNELRRFYDAVISAQSAAITAGLTEKETIIKLKQMTSRSCDLDPLPDILAELKRAANICDMWAEQSRKGGWSTHQVAANIYLANDLRRQVARLEEIAERYLNPEKAAEASS